MDGSLYAKALDQGIKGKSDLHSESYELEVLCICENKISTLPGNESSLEMYTVL